MRAAPRPVLALALTLVGMALSARASQAQFFNAVYARDTIDVIAVADSGAVYRSTSGGIAWTRSFLGTKPLPPGGTSAARKWY